MLVPLEWFCLIHGVHCAQLAVSLSRFCAFSYFISTEYEESGFSTRNFQVGVVDGCVFNPRTGVHNVLRFVDEWDVGMTKYENLARLHCITSGEINFAKRILQSLLRGPVKPLSYRS